MMQCILWTLPILKGPQCQKWLFACLAIDKNCDSTISLEYKQNPLFLVDHNIMWVGATFYKMHTDLNTWRFL